MPIYGGAPKSRNVSRIMVCVDRVELSEPIGRLISPFRREAALFSGVVDVITLADEFFSQVGFPQAYNQDRSFQPTAKAASPCPEPTLVAYMDEETFLAQRGQLATFMILVQFRQNSTWQGTISWREREVEQRFSSTLELLKMMDRALSGGNTLSQG